MPDFEIRYYHAYGKLAVVHMCAYRTVDEAETFAQKNVGEHARFEIINRKTQPIAAR